MSVPWETRPLKSAPVSNDEVLILDSQETDPDLIEKRATLVSLPSSGETNTASNVGVGLGIFKQKVGVDFQFRTVLGQTDKISLADNTDDITFTLGSDVVTKDQANIYEDFAQTFHDDKLFIQNPAESANYQIIASAIIGDRSLTLPLLTTNDTFVTESFTQILTNKTMNANNNSFTNFTIGTQVTGASTDLTDTSNIAYLDTLAIFTAGVQSPFFRSSTTNAATAGTVRLARLDTMGWLNTVGDGNLLFSVNSNDFLLFDSNFIAYTSSQGTSGQILTSNGSGFNPSFQNNTDGTLKTVTDGTITVSNPTILALTDTSGGIDFAVANNSPTATITGTVSSTYAGGTSIATVGTITSGIWNGGTIPVAHGGTGVTTSTGTNSVVLNTSPTIVTPTIASFVNATHDHSDTANGGQLTNTALTSGVFSSITGIGTQTQDLNMNSNSITNAVINASNNTISNITNSEISASAGIIFSKMETITSADIIVGSVLGVPSPVVMSGDATISNTGVVTVTPSLSDGYSFIGDENNVSKGFPVGLQVKESCVVATTQNITLSNSQTIDGVAVVNPNRILVKNQTDPLENGIYIVVNSGAWTRSTDADTDAEVNNGMLTLVTSGTVNTNTTWYLSTFDPITLGSSELDFKKYIIPGITHLPSKTTEVFSLSDLPTPVSGTITIPTGMYVFKNSIDFGTDRIVLPTGSRVVFQVENPLVSSLSFTASSNTFITGSTDANFLIDGIVMTLFGSNGQFFDITGVTQFFNSAFVFDDTATGTKTLGSIGGEFFSMSSVGLENYIEGLTLTSDVLNIANIDTLTDDTTPGTTFNIDTLAGALFTTISVFGGVAGFSIFDIDNSVTGFLNIQNTVDLLGNGIFYKAGGLDQSAPNVSAFNNGTSPNSMIIGGFYVPDQDMTGITGTYADINFSTPVIVLDIQERFQLNNSANGEVEYTGVADADATLQFVMPVDADGLATSGGYEIKFLIDKGAGYVDTTQFVVALFSITSANDAFTSILSATIKVSNGYKIKPQIQRITGGRTTVRLRNTRMEIVGVR